MGLASAVTVTRGRVDCLQEARVGEAQLAGPEHLCWYPDPSGVLHADAARLDDTPRRPSLIAGKSNEQASGLA